MYNNNKKNILKVVCLVIAVLTVVAIKLVHKTVKMSVSTACVSVSQASTKPLPVEESIVVVPEAIIVIETEKKPLCRSKDPVLGVAYDALCFIKKEPTEDIIEQINALSTQDQVKILNYLLKRFLNPNDKTSINVLFKTAGYLKKARSQYSELYSIIHNNKSDLVALMLALRNCNNDRLPEVVLEFKKQANDKVKFSLFKSVKTMAQECLENNYAYLYRKMDR